MEGPVSTTAGRGVRGQWHTLWSIVTGRLKEAGRDLLPVFLVIAVFQLLVLRQPLPNLIEVLIGMCAVVVGLALFIEGLELALFPLGESMANAFARKGSAFWLLSFGFVLGFATTAAEPALIAVTEEAAVVAADASLIDSNEAAMNRYALGMRFTVAVSVGVAVALGVLRILLGWPIHLTIMGGYVLVVLLTIVAPEEIVGIAYDSGGVTTSTVTVPLVTALGIGLAKTIHRRNAMLDGFGLIAFASLLPIAFVLGYGILVFGLGGAG
jgi:uncharacterized protein DUF1538